MKYTIEGFSQEFAMTLKKDFVVGKKTITKKIDCTDLIILRWFVDFYPNMKKIEVDGKQYAWLTHKKLLEDLPIVDISKRSFIDRMQKLVDFEILEYQLLKEGGTFSLYGFGKNYINMIQSKEGMQSNDTGVCNQTANKDKSIIYSSIRNSSIIPYKELNNNNNNNNKELSTNQSSNKQSNTNIYKDIVEYLNDKTKKKFRTTNKDTQKHIHARLEDGFTLEDFQTVIDKKCAEWIGTDFEQYLRPLTLFGTKFESYLNAPMKHRNTVGANGVQMDNRESDELDGIL